MDIVLHVWRQKSATDKGGFVRYDAKNVNEHMSFLEMLDTVNEELLEEGDSYEHNTFL